MPVWLQITLPIITALLGGAAGFGFGRLSRALDRRQERRDAEAAKLPDFVIERDAGGFRIANTGETAATNVTIDFGRFPRWEVGGLPTEPFDIVAGQGLPFTATWTLAYPLPSDALVRCAEIPGGKRIRFPAR